MARQDPEPVLRQLAAEAARARDDEAAAWAWMALLGAVTQAGRLEEAKQLEPVARSALSRVGEDSRLRFTYEMNSGGRASNAGELEAGTRHFTAAAAAAVSPGDRAGALRALAYNLAVRGQHAEARKTVEEAVALGAEVFGTNHPRYADILTYRATVLSANIEPGDLDRARDDYAKALAIQVGIFGEHHREVLHILEVFAVLETSRRDWEAAEGYARRALAILDTIDAPLSRPQVMTTLASIVEARQGFAAARPEYEKALAVSEKVFGKRSLNYANIERTLAAGLSLEGDCKAARAYAERVVAYHTANKSPSVGNALLILGRCDVKDGRRARGLARMNEALAACAGGCIPSDVALVEQELGQLLVDSREDIPRGLALVTAARDKHRTLGEADRASELDRWLAARAAP